MRFFIDKILLKILNKLIIFIPKNFKINYLLFLYLFEKNKEDELYNLDIMINKNGHALDVGSNYGYYSYMLSRIKRIKKIYAFEPNIKISKVNLKYFKKIKVHNVGLSNKNSDRILMTPLINNFEYHGLSKIYDNKKIPNRLIKYKKKKIKVKKLDSYNYLNVVFIKIDIEGHELDFLAGAKNFFLKNKPVCLIEIERKNLKKVVKFFLNLKINYKINRKFYKNVKLTKNNYLFSVE